jgi:hypothetical protein
MGRRELSKFLRLPPHYSNPENLSDEELEMLNYYKGVVAKINTPVAPCIIVYGDTNLDDFKFEKGEDN